MMKFTTTTYATTATAETAAYNSLGLLDTTLKDLVIYTFMRLKRRKR
jgi:hypothetical protein